MQRRRRARPSGRRSLSAEYQAEVVAAFLASGKPIAEVAHAYELPERTLREWVRQAADDVAREETAGPERHAAPESWVDPDATSAEYQAEVVALYRTSGKTIAEVAYTLNLAESTVREWLWHASPDIAPGKALVNNGAPGALSALDDASFVPEVLEPEFEEKGPAAEGAPTARRSPRPGTSPSACEKWVTPEVEVATPPEVAEAMAQAEAKATEAEKALARAKTKAAKDVARAQTAAAEVEATAREEIAAVYAAAVEAMVRSEVAAAEAVAQAEVAARVEAEAAAREEIAAVYAAAVEAVVRAEVSAAEKVARAEAAKAHAASVDVEVAVADAQARFGTARAEALALREAGACSEVLAAEAAALAQAEVAAWEETEAAARTEIAAADAAAARIVAPETVAVDHADVATVEAQAPAPALAEIEPWAAVGAAVQSEAGPEAAARAEIAELVSRLEPVEVWVQAIGRTVAEARRAALDLLGVDESEAEFEILSKGFRLVPGRVRIRARIRVPEGSRS